MRISLNSFFLLFFFLGRSKFSKRDQHYNWKILKALQIIYLQRLLNRGKTRERGKRKQRAMETILIYHKTKPKKPIQLQSFVVTLVCVTTRGFQDGLYVCLSGCLSVILWLWLWVCLCFFSSSWLVNVVWLLL